MSSSVFYDFDLASNVQGNPDLKSCYVHNLDFRYELYTAPGEQISIAAFFKHFADPIEWTYTVTGGTDMVYSYQNADKAVSYGIEVDRKKNLDFTTMFSNKDLKKNSKTANRKKLMRTNTQDITRPYKSKTITNEQAVISSQHEENLRLLKSGLISKEEFEILEDRLYKNK